MQNDQLTEQLATLLWDKDYLPGYEGLDYLDDADSFLTTLGLDHWISPDTLQAKLRSLDEPEARARWTRSRERGRC
jgi:hypothetical protein